MADAMLTQDEIDALLSGVEESADAPSKKVEATAQSGIEFTPNQLAKFKALLPTLTSSYTSSLSSISSKSAKVEMVSCERMGIEEAFAGYEDSVLVMRVSYDTPEAASVFHIFKQKDGLKFVSLVTGSETKAWGDAALSAAKNAFLQMIQSGDTALSSQFNIDVKSGDSKLSQASVSTLPIPMGEYVVIKWTYHIEGAIESTFHSVYPLKLVTSLIENQSSGGKENLGGMENLLSEDDGGIQAAEFSPLGQLAKEPEVKGNINLLLDVDMEVTVELGRSSRTVKDILSLGEGSIIELDKLAGEPVDLLANGKPIAKGEVVVIDENFGVRVTEIINPKQRASIASAHIET